MKKLMSALIEINEIEKDKLVITLALNSDSEEELSINNIQTKEVIAKGLNIIIDTRNLIQEVLLPNFNEEGLEKIKKEITQDNG